MIRVPENYSFDQGDYWDLRDSAIEKLSLSAYEEVIEFGQKYGYDKARFDLNLEYILCQIYFRQDRKDKYVFCHEEGENRIANENVYPFLDELFARDDFSAFDSSRKSYSGYYQYPQLHDSPLFFVMTQGDCRMLEYLLDQVDHDAAYHQGLYDAVLKYYLFMKLPDWGPLANITGTQNDLLCAVENQANAINVPPPIILRCLFQAGFPSAYTRLPLEYSNVRIIQNNDNDFHFTVDHVDISTSPRGNGALGYVHNNEDMVRALSSSGKFYPFTCECGEEGCAGLWERIQCFNTPTGMRWYKPYPLPMSFFVFEPLPVLKELEKALTAIVKRLEPEWSKKTEKNDVDELEFPYGPYGTSFSSLKRNLKFCRETRTRMEMKNTESYRSSKEKHHK